MTTSARLRCHDGLPGHWMAQTPEQRISAARLAALLGIGLGGCLGGITLVLRLYPLG